METLLAGIKLCGQYQIFVSLFSEGECPVVRAIPRECNIVAHMLAMMASSFENNPQI